MAGSTTPREATSRGSNSLPTDRLRLPNLERNDSGLSKLPNGTTNFETVPVALYDMSSNTLLGRVKVSASDPAIGVYRYAALSRSITLNTTSTYAVVWVSLSDYYVASPTLVASDVNSAIRYLAFASYGPGGLTTTSTMVEPNWFFTESANGLHALNYDLGPNFMFSTPSDRFGWRSRTHQGGLRRSRFFGSDCV